MHQNAATVTGSAGIISLSLPNELNGLLVLQLQHKDWFVALYLPTLGTYLLHEDRSSEAHVQYENLVIPSVQYPQHIALKQLALSSIKEQQ